MYKLGNIWNEAGRVFFNILLFHHFVGEKGENLGQNVILLALNQTQEFLKQSIS
jgi:hypothetical protein